MNIEKVGVVYQTTDYGMFAGLVGNRDVMRSRVERIKKSIKENGWITNPIVVNELYEVIDGQGRLMALKELKMPVQYVISKGAGLKECVELNIAQTNWKPVDYAKSYADAGNENYKRLMSLCELYKTISFQCITWIAANMATSTHGIRRTQDGKYKLSKKAFERCKPGLSFISEHHDSIKKLTGASIVIKTSLAWIVNNTEADQKRLAEVIQKRYTQIDPAFSPDQFIENLSKLYNKQLKSGWVYFDDEYRKAKRRH